MLRTELVKSENNNTVKAEYIKQDFGAMLWKFGIIQVF